MGLSLVDCLWYGNNNEYWSWPKLSWNLSRGIFPKIKHVQYYSMNFVSGRNKIHTAATAVLRKKNQPIRHSWLGQFTESVAHRFACFLLWCWWREKFESNQKKFNLRYKKADHLDCASPGVVNKSSKSHIIEYACMNIGVFTKLSL